MRKSNKNQDVKKMDKISEISVLKYRLPDIYTRLEKFNKKLKKKGISPLTIDVGEPYDVEEYQHLYGTQYQRITVKMVDLTVHHEIPILKEKGFEYVGTVSYKDGVKTIFNNTKDTNLFKINIDYKWCDHCQTRRNRNTISFFRHMDGKSKGHMIQIGSTCVKEYFGLDLVYALTAGTNIVRSLYNEYGDGLSRESEEFSNIFTFKRIMATAVYVIRKDKRYISSQGDGYMNAPTPTATQIDNIRYVPISGEDYYKKEKEEIIKYMDTDEWKVLCEKIEKYWNDLEPSNDFESNVKERYVSYNVRSTALIACGVYTVIKGEFDSKKNGKIKKVNNYIGNIGDTGISNVTVTKEIPFDGRYGPGIIIQMLTDDGYTLKWFTSYTKKSGSLSLDSEKTISYEIKDHNEYNDWKSTIVKVKNVVDKGEKIDPGKGKKKVEFVNPFENLTPPTGRKWTRDKVRDVVENNEDAQKWVLITIFNYQTESEKDSEHTMEYNEVGFSGVDGEFATSLAKQLIKKGELSEKQKPYLEKYALKYSRQFAKHLNKVQGL